VSTPQCNWQQQQHIASCTHQPMTLTQYRYDTKPLPLHIHSAGVHVQDKTGESSLAKTHQVLSANPAGILPLDKPSRHRVCSYTVMTGEILPPATLCDVMRMIHQACTSMHSEIVHKVLPSACPSCAPQHAIIHTPLSSQPPPQPAAPHSAMRPGLLQRFHPACRHPHRCQRRQHLGLLAQHRQHKPQALRHTGRLQQRLQALSTVQVQAAAQARGRPGQPRRAPQGRPQRVRGRTSMPSEAANAYLAGNCCCCCCCCCCGSEPGLPGRRPAAGSAASPLLLEAAGSAALGLFGLIAAALAWARRCAAAAAAAAACASITCHLSNRRRPQAICLMLLPADP